MLAEEFKVAAKYYRSDWLDPEQLETLPGIGRSYTATKPMHGFLGLALTVREAGSKQESQTREVFELGQDSSVNLVDAQGNLYLFRVVSLLRDQSLSASQMLANDQLRRKVISDTIGRQAYRKASDKAQDLFALAEKMGLRNALAESKGKDLKIHRTGVMVRDDWKKALSEVRLPLIDSQEQIYGEVILGWQDLGVSPQLGQPASILLVQIDNKAAKGKITAVGLSLPGNLRLTCSQIPAPKALARNGGPAVPAGPEGYMLEYSGRAIDAGQAGKLDLLIGAEGQGLVAGESLSEAGVEPGGSQMFLLQLPHTGIRLTAVNFARSLSLEPSEGGGQGWPLAARLEIGGKNILLRGIYPANRRLEFLRECFSVLDRTDLQRKPDDEPKDKPEELGEEASAAVWDLLTAGESQEAPCAIVELPRERI